MRVIEASLISEKVKEMCIEANYALPKDIYALLKKGISQEEMPLSKGTLEVIKRNADIAKSKKRPICQDTGMACIFIELGQDVHIEGNLTDAINEGVRQGYVEGYLRKSVVADPLFERKNTNDNTPALIHYEIVPGDKLKIIVAPKGFGSENMCQLKMLKPSDGVEGVKQFVLDTVEQAGPNPCPPIVIGVGIGGNFENVGYARAGTEGIYNIEIMEERQSIAAFGAGGVSKVYTPAENRIERVPNVKGIEQYISRIDEMIQRKKEGFCQHDR